MFRFEDHMPEYWENESRDFQLLTRLNDLVFMGQRADIATIQNLNSSKKCKNSLLPILAKKVGFFTDKDIEDDVLRNIIGAFRLAVKHKGTKKGILYAVTAILKAEKSTGQPEIIINKDNTHTIEIFTPVKLVNEVALREFLKYIVPAGFIVNIYSYVSDVTPRTSEFNQETLVRWGKYYTANVGKVRDDDLGDIAANNIPTDDDIDKNNTYLRQNYFGSMNLGSVISLEDLNNMNSEETNSETSGLIKANFGKESGIEIGGQK